MKRTFVDVEGAVLPNRIPSAVIVPGTFAGGEIEPGTFHGGEIEPGTFHVWVDDRGEVNEPLALPAGATPAMRS